MAALAAGPLAPTKPRTRRPKTAPATVPSSTTYSSRVVPPTMIPDSAFRTPPTPSAPTFGTPDRISPRDDDGNDADDDDERRGSNRQRRISLAPRPPKRNDYFHVDFSFLDEEPTFLKSSAAGQRTHEIRPSSFRRISGASDGSMHSSKTWKESYANMLREDDGASVSTARTNRDSSGSLGLTFPNASRPFPSRPSRARPAMNGHRSGSSGELGELVFAGSTLDKEEASLAQNRSSHARHQSLDDNGEALDRRRRMARVLLDKTAAAMEGGKSLAMAKQQMVDEASQLESEAAALPDATAAAEKRAKRAEKRRRTILELCETEVSYASDMAVVRDIFLERAKGTDLGVIADRVIASGLGLKSATSPTSATFSPTSPVAQDFAPRRQSTASTASSLAPPTSSRRRHRPSSADSDRRISSQSFAEKLEKRRATMQQAPASSTSGQAPLLTPRDVHLVFANLEQIAELAQVFSGVLDGAKGSDVCVDDDRIGEVFVEMIPRLQNVYSTYCARHHRAIMRLQELEPELKTYLQECEQLCHGRTALPNLPALLIKPVQRCLKYPLLLDQILALTPDDHPDRAALQRANQDALAMAEHINEYKKRSETVDRVVNRPQSTRRDSTRSISSSVSKKFLRSTQKAKTAVGLGEQGERDDMFETLATLVDSTKSAVVRFCNEMKDWSRTSKLALDSQVTLVEGWIKLYAPIGNERESPSYERLVVFQDEVLLPLIEGPWKELDYEIRNSLILKTDHLLSLFDNPSRVIAKRNDKQLDHVRYVKRKDPADKRGSEEYQILTAQLLEELPRFLGSVSRYFNIVVNHFGGAQAAYNEAIQERWDAYAEVWLTQIPAGRPEQIQEAFERHHLRIDEMMRTLANGLGISHNPPTPPKTSAHSSARHSRHSSSGSAQHSSASPVTTPLSASSPTFASPITHAQPLPPAAYQAGFKNYSLSSSANGATPRPRPRHAPRLSVDSDISTSYLSSHRSSTWTTATASTTASSIPEMPSPALDHVKGIDSPAMSSSVASQLRRPSYHSKQSIDSLERRLSFVSELARVAAEGERPAAFWRRRSSTASGLISAYVDDEFDEAEADEEQDQSLAPTKRDEEPGQTLYRAEAMRGTKSHAFRSGYAILSFETGDEIDVLVEEADRAEGGAGWLLARKVLSGEVGWARTEDFAVAD
ncbi:hypothetical protein ACM66B_000941 [Microbotryomycetes sp. NB124-2]